MNPADYQSRDHRASAESMESGSREPGKPGIGHARKPGKSESGKPGARPPVQPSLVAGPGRRDILIFPATIDCASDRSGSQPDLLPDAETNAQAVLLEDDQPVEWLRPPASGEALRQDIFLGQVAQIHPALQVAFIDIGLPLQGWLPQRQAAPGLVCGQPVVVQIRRLAAAGKGHQLTGRPQLPGPFAVLDLALNRCIRRSKLAAFPVAEQDKLFAADSQRLQQLWQQLLTEAGHGPVPRRLARFAEPIPQALNNWPTQNLASIQVEGADLFARVDRLLQATEPWLRPLLRIHPQSSDYSLAALFRISDLAEQTTRRRVMLSHGGWIVLDPTEALLAIDVNSGKASARDQSELHRQTNQLAARTIARHLRLRNVGGLVVIDFIRLAAADQAALQSDFTAILARDRGRIDIGGFTTLGLFELYRHAL